jgi:hypothetical protein
MGMLMTVKRLAALALLCLGLLFGSAHQAQATSPYADWATSDLYDGYVYAYYAYSSDNPFSMNAYWASAYAYAAQSSASSDNWYDAYVYGYWAWNYASISYQEVNTTNTYEAQYLLYYGQFYAYYVYFNN